MAIFLGFHWTWIWTADIWQWLEVTSVWFVCLPLLCLILILLWWFFDFNLFSFEQNSLSFRGNITNVVKLLILRTCRICSKIYQTLGRLVSLSKICFVLVCEIDMIYNRVRSMIFLVGHWCKWAERILSILSCLLSWTFNLLINLLSKLIIKWLLTYNSSIQLICNMLVVIVTSILNLLSWLRLWQEAGQRLIRVRRVWNRFSIADACLLLDTMVSNCSDHSFLFFAWATFRHGWIEFIKIKFVEQIIGVQVLNLF